MATIATTIMAGRGSVVAYRNRLTNPDPIETVTPGDGTVMLTYNIGDIFEFDAYPDTPNGYSFGKYCDVPDCSPGVVSTTFTGTITQQSGNLYVYFVGTPATINVHRTSGTGLINVRRNTRLIGTLLETDTSKTFDFYINDEFSFEATPSSGFVFEKFCADTGCTIPTTSNPFVGTVISASGNLYAYFNPTGGAGGGTILIALLGIAALGIMMSAKKS